MQKKFNVLYMKQLIAVIFWVYLDTTYFAENWKHCSKIIFKYVNSAVGSIFNGKVVEKWSLWVPWTVNGIHWCALYTKKKSKITAQKKEKRENIDVGSAKRASQMHFLYVMMHHIIVWSSIKTNENIPYYSMITHQDQWGCTIK